MTAKEYIESYTKRCSNETTKYGCYDHTYQPWLTPENALAAVEIERQDVIDRVCDFFENDLCCYIVAQDFVIDHGRLEADFKKYING